MKDIKPQTLFGIVATAVILLVGGYFIYSDITSFSSDLDIDVTGSVVTATPEDEIGDVEESKTELIGNESILNNTPSSPQPDLDRPVVFYNEDLPDEAKERYTEFIATLTSELKSDPSTLSHWLDLGIMRKAIGDYEAARDIWVYAGELRPASNIPFLNLGDLYHFFLKDFPKAESSFRIAIANNPAYIQGYTMLHELYKYSYKQETTAAVDALEEGLEIAPTNVNLLGALALYYSEKGDAENASLYYQKARDEAKKQGDSARAAMFEQELNNL